MSWRTVVIEENAKLDYQLGYMVVRKDKIIKIHLSEISNVIIETTAVSITSALLCELIKNKIKVIFCDEKRNPLSELMPCHGSHDSSRKIRNQIKWDGFIKEKIWTEIVRQKITCQKELLHYLGRYKEDNIIKSYIEEIKQGDETNREGHAAKVYFNSLFGMNFTRDDCCEINSALNYGYSIILSAFNREISACGYITQIGIFHDNIFNHFNLSSDLMEPFRPLIDKKVYFMNMDRFGKDEKRELLSVLNMEVYIGGRKEYVNNAIGIYCRSVFEALNEKDPSIIEFYRNEL